jgi:NADH:ubiquinone oxidoreductase subunit 6 (subunit J)
MIFEILSAGLVISACLAIFLDEAVYSVVALASTFIFVALLYVLNDALFVAIFQFAVGAGTLAILFLSGEMLSEKPAKKTPRRNLFLTILFGVFLSSPAIFLSISSPSAAVSGVSFEEALWNLRAVDVVLQGLVMMAVALGIAIVLYEKRNGAK